MRAIAALVLLAGAQASTAASLAVRVDDGDGHPVSDAIVTLVPAATAARRAAPVTRIVDQKDETFVPYVEAFRPGDRVVFRNSDRTRHHVYSFSPVRSFEFVLGPGESSQPVTLANPGTVAVGCNIHDHMIAYLRIDDAPYAAPVAQGHATLAGLPAGRYEARVWHPQQRREALPQAIDVRAGEARELAFSIPLLPDPRRAPDTERSGY